MAAWWWRKVADQLKKQKPSPPPMGCRSDPSGHFFEFLGITFLEIDGFGLRS
jgi:hypothetical protein